MGEERTELASAAHIVDTLGGPAPAVRKRVLARNAVELYNLPF